MPTRRLLLLSLVALAGLVLAGLALPGQPRRADATLAAVFDPYAAAPLQPFADFRDAVKSGDALALQKLAGSSDGYLAYRAALELARWKTIDAATRLAYYRRALALRIDDPLARDETHALTLEAGRTAEAAGAIVEAVGYYLHALPLDGAAAGLERLVPDRRQLARDFLDARMYRRALAALRDVPDPAITAQAQLDLGNYREALPAYRRWTAQAPADVDARTGLAWTLFHLERYQEADAVFQSLGTDSALYGRALIANKDGDVDTAVRLLVRTGRADDMWLATGILEGKDRYADAIPIYLRIARAGSSYADDAAYRAFVLAKRLGMTATADAARSLIPDGSFFALKLGSGPDVPTPPPAAVPAGRVAGSATPSFGATPADPPGPASRSPLAAAAGPSGPDGGAAADVTATTLALARALVAVHDPSTAVGELLFRLRALGATTDAPAPPAPDAEGDIVRVAEMLQSLDEYRQSVYAARELITRGSRSLAVWRLAYPTAYAPDVERRAAAAGVSPAVVWAVMRKESAFSPVAVSRSDAIGLMQVTPPTWDWLGQLQGDAVPADPFDPQANIRYGTTYLGFLLRHFDGSLELAVSSYNRGQGYIGRLLASPAVHGNMDDLYRAIDSYETREYMQDVLLNVAVYEALYPGRFSAPMP
ncbi:MAG TPA: transglycosylase SLT domain-containing protein [Trueperaceae bacterium]|nr:transglycosylase SLT domain-containing protein [Trueperaceae bacterium]